MTDRAPARPQQTSPLLYTLGLTMLLFIGILIVVYVVTKRTHPIYLDEHGRPTNAETAPRHSHDR